jgi:hypothetical protein
MAQLYLITPALTDLPLNTIIELNLNPTSHATLVGTMDNPNDGTFNLVQNDSLTATNANYSVSIQ